MSQHGANDQSQGSIKEFVKKHFSVDDLVVFLVCEGIGVPFTIAGGEAAVHEDWKATVIGFGVGIPMMAIGFTFPFWKNYVWARLREYIVRLAFLGIPVILLLAIVYELGPYLFVGNVKGAASSADEIAAAVVRAMPKTPATAPEPTDSAPSPYVNPVHSAVAKWQLTEGLRTAILKGNVRSDCKVVLVPLPVQYAQDYAADFEEILYVAGISVEKHLATTPVDKGISLIAAQSPAVVTTDNDCAFFIDRAISNWSTRRDGGGGLSGTHMRRLPVSEAPESIRNCPANCVQINFGNNDGQ
jgi:hypothetical protein